MKPGDLVQLTSLSDGMTLWRDIVGQDTNGTVKKGDLGMYLCEVTTDISLTYAFCLFGDKLGWIGVYNLRKA